jgi:hypothetical protein
LTASGRTPIIAVLKAPIVVARAGVLGCSTEPDVAPHGAAMLVHGYRQTKSF